MPRGGDEFGIGVLVMGVCVIAFSMVFGLFKAIVENPWLIAFCIAAGLIYMLARRAASYCFQFFMNRGFD